MGQPTNGFMVSVIAEDVHKTLGEDQLTVVVLFDLPLHSDTTRGDNIIIVIGHLRYLSFDYLMLLCSGVYEEEEVCTVSLSSKKNNKKKRI